LARTPRTAVQIRQDEGMASPDCPNRRRSALFRGNTSVATGSCSRGPTDESGHAVIEWHVKAFFRWSVFF